MGLGFVIRNHVGKFVGAKCFLWKGKQLVKEAEALGIQEALRWVKSLGIERVLVETYRC